MQKLTTYVNNVLEQFDMLSLWAYLVSFSYNQNITPSNETRQKLCRDPGLNQGPSDLQSDALPTELSRLRNCFSGITFRYNRKLLQLISNQYTRNYKFWNTSNAMVFY